MRSATATSFYRVAESLVAYSQVPFNRQKHRITGETRDAGHETWPLFSKITQELRLILIRVYHYNAFKTYKLLKITKHK